MRQHAGQRGQHDQAGQQQRAGREQGGSGTLGHGGSGHAGSWCLQLAAWLRRLMVGSITDLTPRPRSPGRSTVEQAMSERENGDASVVDVAIVGAGLVGASLACALDALGLRTLLVEASAGGRQPAPSFDERNLALGLASINALTALG